MQEQSFCIQLLTQEFQRVTGRTQSITLRKEQEDKLIAKARSGDRDAFRRLFASVIPYIIKVARRYVRVHDLSVYTQEDVISACAIAFNRAVKTYDQERSDASFVGSLGEQMRRVMHDEVLKRDTLYRIPANKRQIARDCKWAVQRIKQKQSRAPSGADEVYEEIQSMAEEITHRPGLNNISRNDVEWFWQYRDAAEISLYKETARGEDTTFMDALETSEPGPVANFFDGPIKPSNIRRSFLERWMRYAKLDTRERDIILRYFGISHDPPQTLTAIAATAEYDIGR